MNDLFGIFLAIVVRINKPMNRKKSNILTDPNWANVYSNKGNIYVYKMAYEGRANYIYSKPSTEIEGLLLLFM